MLLDLLRLASIGQNMELYASLRVREPSNSGNHVNHQQQQARNNRANQRQQAASDRRVPRAQVQLNQAMEQQDQAQHKPLDLSVKTTPVQHGSTNSTTTKQTTSEMSLSVHEDGLVRLRLKSRPHSKNKKLLPLQGKHITSTTSPSSCSRSASSVSSVESINNNLGNCEVISSTNLNEPKLGCDPLEERGSQMNGKLKCRKQKGAKSHLCNQCGRSFSRSDMLTRHSRLHSGLKPYQCSRCKQVFSRSDHLSTHERTHTGEKPYQCQFCSYSACRRDMITRHLRIHSARPRIRSKRRASKQKMGEDSGVHQRDEDMFEVAKNDDSNSATSSSDVCDLQEKVNDIPC